jgi:hypothetical protein
VPDLRGMVAGGKTDMGGSDRGNLTGGTVLGAGLGGQIGISTSMDGENADVTVQGGTGVLVANAGHTHGNVHTPVVQPTIILNYIIKT